MKFSSTVDSLSRENRSLRLMLGCLALGVCLLSTAVLLLDDRPPKLVLRSTRGFELVTATPLQRTESDVRNAVRLMLKARLDTENVAPEIFLSQRQLDLRTAEQRELKSRGFFQAVIVRNLDLKPGAAVATFDRLIAVGEVRSALSTQANLTFEEVEPNELNPYGLKLAGLVPIESKQTGAARDGGLAAPHQALSPKEEGK